MDTLVVEQVRRIKNTDGLQMQSDGYTLASSLCFKYIKVNYFLGKTNYKNVNLQKAALKEAVGSFTSIND
jgi:hypothetical protein